MGVVPGEGLEPTRPEGQRILSPPRLPIPPSRHAPRSWAAVLTISKPHRSVSTLMRCPSVRMLISPRAAVSRVWEPIRPRLRTTD